MKLAGSSNWSADWLRMPPSKAAYAFNIAFNTMTDSILGMRFQERWERCFSLREDVAERYADIISGTYYQRKALNGVALDVLMLIRTGMLPPDRRLIFDECVELLKEAIVLLSDCEPPAVLSEERSQLEAIVADVELAFDDFEKSLKSLQPAHLMLQRHLELFFLITTPHRPKDTVYESGDADERAKLDRSYERAAKAHQDVFRSLAELRDEAFPLVRPEQLRRYLEELDRIEAQKDQLGLATSHLNLAEELDLAQLRDQLEVAVMTLELDDELLS